MRETILQTLPVNLSKKHLQKGADIWKMRAFLKLPKMATMQRLMFKNGEFRSKIEIASKLTRGSVFLVHKINK